MSFLHSFFGTCCGPSVFKELKNHSWLKVIWHFFLVCFLCSIGVGIGNYMMVKYRWRAAYNNFNDIFGSGIVFTEQGVLPEKSPEISRRQELPYNSLLIYISPNGPEADYPDETLRDRNIIILWSSACLVMFVRQDDDLWSSVSHFPGEQLKYSTELMDYKKMKEELFRCSKLPGSDKWTYPDSWENGFNTSQLFSLVRLSFAFGKAFFFFVASVVLTLFSTFFFSVFFRVFTFGRKMMLSFGTLWKVAIYAAFPVLLVVNAFPMLQLPATAYFNYLFLIGWTVYLFFVLRYLIVCHNENNDGNEENNEQA